MTWPSDLVRRGDRRCIRRAAADPGFAADEQICTPCACCAASSRCSSEVFCSNRSRTAGAGDPCSTTSRRRSAGFAPPLTTSDSVARSAARFADIRPPPSSARRRRRATAASSSASQRAYRVERLPGDTVIEEIRRLDQLRLRVRRRSVCRMRFCTSPSGVTMISRTRRSDSRRNSMWRNDASRRLGVIRRPRTG